MSEPTHAVRDRFVPGWGRRLTVGLLVAVGAVVLVGAGPARAGTAGTRSERLGKVRISAELFADGSLHVVERRTFVYDGSWQGARYDLPLLEAEEITLHRLAEDGMTYRPGTCSPDGAKTPGAYETREGAGSFAVIWCWDPPPTDTTRTIVLDYTVSNAGIRHEDSAELYWQFVGASEIPPASVVVDVQLPVRDGVRFWAHGPPHGSVDQIAPGLIRLRVDAVPRLAFVELRALMPAAALAQAESDGERVRPRILEEERCSAVAANADRTRARGEVPSEDCDPGGTVQTQQETGAAIPGAGAANRPFAGALNGMLALGLVAGVGLAAANRRRGRPQPLPDGLPDYERDLPSDHPPAFVDRLLHMELTDKALVATILDLVRRGHITLRRDGAAEGSDEPAAAPVVFERGPDPERPWERAVCELLFERAGNSQDTVSGLQLRRWVSRNRWKALNWWQTWTLAVRRDMKGLRWFQAVGSRGGDELAGDTIPKIIATAAVAVPVAAVVFGGAHLTLAIVTGVCGVAASQTLRKDMKMRRHTPKGRVLAHRWRRFGAYLADYSMMSELGPEHLASWGRWLVYAVPLGVADTVMQNLDAHLSDAELRQGAGAWRPVRFGRDDLGFATAYAQISDMFPTDLTSPPRSSGGGWVRSSGGWSSPSGTSGGGFSSGGGKGHGGASSSSF